MEAHRQAGLPGFDFVEFQDLLGASGVRLEQWSCRQESPSSGNIVNSGRAANPKSKASLFAGKTGMFASDGNGVLGRPSQV